MADLQRALSTLEWGAAHPRERLEHYLAEGRQAVGCFAPYAPEELVHASGMIPFGLWGGKTELEYAKSYLPAFACPIMQANMEFGVRGTYDGLSAVIIPAICDTLRCMTQNWRFGVKSIPMIPIVYPQNRSIDASVDYLISEYENVLLMLTTLTGNMMSEASLKDTIRIYNEHSALMREFSAVANEHLDIVTPRVRHAVMKSAYFYEKSEHSALVREVIEGLRQLPSHRFNGKKILLAGILCEPAELLDVLAENHLAVVGDDLAQEMRQYRTDIPTEGGGAIRRLALQWRNRYGCSLIHEIGKPRGHMLTGLCRETGADGVINCLMKFCDPEEYDQPYLEQDLRHAGVPVMTVEIDPLSTGYEQYRTRIQSFAEML